MATIKEIAARAGVSIGTVDRVLHNRGHVSPEKQEEILRLVKDLGYTPNASAQGLIIARKKLRLAFFSLNPSQHPFFRELNAGARQEAERLRQYSVEVDFYELSPGMTSVDPSSLRVDGIAMVPLPQLQNIQDWAIEQKIPLTSVNSRTAGCTAFVGCDYHQAGRIAAGLTGLISGGKGDVIIVSEGNDTVISYRDRIEGFCSELARCCPGMNADQRYFFINRTDLPKLPRQRPAAFYLVNPGDYHICRTLHEYYTEPVPIITNDRPEECRKLMEEGIITATVCQQPEQQGALALSILVDLATGRQEAAGDHYTELSIHIPQNI